MRTHDQPRRYRLTTLGCRVNHAETRDLESVLVQRGLIPAGTGEPSDLEIIHTCSVTQSAAAKSRQAIRRAYRRRHAGSDARSPEVIVTGCFVGTNPSEAQSLASSPDLAIPHAEPEQTSNATLVDRFTHRLDRWLSGVDRSHHHEWIRPTASTSSRPAAIIPLPIVPPAAGTGRHIRAELRIQDGCDAHCTFCIIPRIRPTLRSKSIADAVREARMLVGRGHCEIVLTGIFIGAFGHETALRRCQQRAGTSPLADLLDAVANVPGVHRLRISSMEPGDVNEPLLDAIVANAPIVVPHLHLPLQSGSDAVLRRMNRQYRVGDYMEMVDMVNAALTTGDGLPPALTTDIIAGFPGETEEDFASTVEVARRVGYLHIHAFPYSPRAGTAAARWTDRMVPEQVARARVRQLIDLERDPAEGLSKRYRERLVGRTVRVILEQPVRHQPGVMQGRCDHYALIRVPTDSPRGSLMLVDVRGVDGDVLTGETVSPRIALPVLS